METVSRSCYYNVASNILFGNYDGELANMAKRAYSWKAIGDSPDWIPQARSRFHLPNSCPSYGNLRLFYSRQMADGEC